MLREDLADVAPEEGRTAQPFIQSSLGSEEHSALLGHADSVRDEGQMDVGVGPSGPSHVSGPTLTQ
ncbi:hypothetical protein Airi02_062710 [Actinoallomurus iriomotensis]|uniref:Uncharacterized protein n=1 Tax=Actinoallomurus iriomotensis TaxID=478107 RepID=A0A9W6W2Y2_9ACTN|nr:hypothetical protein Airi02_062710 [Actinoallomurus iriomotensis]